jgi:D-alanyl-D-alanine carboxypeptidase/D-alanyl-D-alanine-endopeptidase (penicillin-binding protein 4)
MATGTVPAGYQPTEPEERIAVESPPEYAATVFEELLGRRGILVRGTIGAGKLPADARLLKLHESSPLSDVLPLLNKPSDNLIAEALLKTLGVETGRSGSWQDGAAAVLSFLQKCGVDASSAAVADGSGLSRLNCVSPRVLVKTLRYMADGPEGGLFADSLPIAGVDGTLAHRMSGTAAQGKVRAKTGYVTHVCALSGYLTASSGARFAFSIILNNHLCANRQATAAQDAICEVLVRDL